MRLIPLLFLFATPAMADLAPDRLSFLLGSYHVDPASDFEEVNPGVFLTWEGVALDGRVDLNAGVFRNSYGRAAVAATGTFTLAERDNFALGVFAGAAYYPEDGRRFAVSLGDVVPLAGVQAIWGPAFVQFIPQDGNEADAVFAFGLTLPLGR